MVTSRAGRENCLNWEIFPDAPDANKHQMEISRLGSAFSEVFFCCCCCCFTPWLLFIKVLLPHSFRDPVLILISRYCQSGFLLGSQISSHLSDACKWTGYNKLPTVFQPGWFIPSICPGSQNRTRTTRLLKMSWTPEFCFPVAGLQNHLTADRHFMSYSSVF